MGDLVSEFGGEDGPTGLPLKPSSALTAFEKLRLGYTVGKEDTTEPANRRAWTGELLES